jgi:hypothetical protein
LRIPLLHIAAVSPTTVAESHTISNNPMSFFRSVSSINSSRFRFYIRMERDQHWLVNLETYRSSLFSFSVIRFLKASRGNSSRHFLCAIAFSESAKISTLFVYQTLSFIKIYP